MSLFGFGGKKDKKTNKSKKSKPREIWQGKSHGLDDIISPSALVGGSEHSPEAFVVDLPPVSGSEFDLMQSDLLKLLEQGNLDSLLQPPDNSFLDHQTIIDWFNNPSSQPLSFSDNPVATSSLPESISIQHNLNSCQVENHASLAGKELPGSPSLDGITRPTILVTGVDTGSNNLANPTSLVVSNIKDIIDQVSGIDPIDVYKVNINDLKNADISVLSGQISVDYLMPSGQFLGSQFFSAGNYTLLPPAGITGDVVVKINYQGGTPGTYILNGFETKNHSEPFNIDLEFGGGLSASQQAIIQAAAKSVESIISQGLPTAIVDGKLIDDVNFKVSATNLDGAGGTAAQTKIDFMRFGTMLPAQSITQLDAADIAELERSGELFSVVQHELLHGLGFGNLWEAKGLVDYAGTPLAQYNGQEAVKAFQELGGLTSHINLENNGNGSAGLHWNENIFQDEVMTADYNNGKDGNAPISLVTIASLADLGYQVNLNRATPDYGLFGGQGFNTNDLTPEELEAFRELAETSFSNPGEEFIYATMPEVNPDTVAPEIWAHAERFWKNGRYYDWQPYQVRWGDTLSQIALDTMGSANPDYYWWIANHNGIPNPDYIVASDGIRKQWIDIPVYHPNYEQQQEAKRLADLARLEEEQRQEAERKKQAQEKLKNDLAEQEKLKQDQERLKQEAEAKQKELEEQAQKLAEDLKRRQQQEWEQQQARLKEIERQKGLGGEDWYLATPLPEFGPVDPFETKLTGETVGNLVPDDYYRFTLSRNGRVTAQLKQLLADADLVLYDARNRPISYSMRDGITDEQLIADLIPGTYLIRVNSPKGVTTDYELIVKFKHLLSQSEIGPPPGWRVGGGTGGGSGNAGPIFSDPRIESIYKNALNIFSNAERAKANAQILQLEREKQGYQQDLQKLLDQMNGEQRAKVHDALNNARNYANVWVDNIANPIKDTVDNLADGIINTANSFANNLENQVNQISDWGNQWIRDRKDEAKRFIRQGRDAVTSAVNGARSWLKAKLIEIQNGVKSAISHFFETIKNAYRTGGEINQIIANAAQSFRNTVDQAVRGANDLIAGFKGQVLSAAKWTENMGINIDKFGIKVNFNAYNNIVKPAVDAVADGYNSVIGGIGNTLKGIVNWIEPRTQKVVADIVNALLGDKTGYLWNEINGVDAKIAATRTGLERAINDKAALYKRLLDDFVKGLGDAGNFVIGALMGEFNDNPSIWQTLLDSGIGMIPIVGEIGDVRDLIAYTKKFIDKPEEMQDPWNWVGVVGSLVGLVPVFGGAVKGVTKVARNADFITEIRKLGPGIVDAIIDFAKKTDWSALAVKSKNFYGKILDVVEGLSQKLKDGIRAFDDLLPKLGILQPEYAGIGKLPDEGFFGKIIDNVQQLRREAPKKIDEGFSFLKGKLDDLASAKKFYNISGNLHEMFDPVKITLNEIPGSYINVTRSSKSKVYIYDTFIPEAYRKQGYGRSLVKALEEQVSNETILHFKTNDDPGFWAEMGFQEVISDETIIKDGFLYSEKGKREFWKIVSK